MEIIGDLAEAFTPLAEALWPVFALFTRLSLFFFLAPVIGERSVPARVRLGFALLTAFLLYPVLQDQIGTVSDQSIFSLLASEALTGFVLGFSLRLAVHFLQFLGMIVSQSLSLSQPLGEGIASEPNTTISTLFMVAGVTLLVSLDLHIALLGILANSFQDMPLGLFISLDVSASWLTDIVVGLFRLCLSLALPFMVLNFAYNLILGFLNRAMPQLLVSFVGLPGITLAGLFLLMVCASAMIMAWLDAYRAISLGMG